MKITRYLIFSLNFKIKIKYKNNVWRQKIIGTFDLVIK
jgi:hypothetical protein